MKLYEIALMTRPRHKKNICIFFLYILRKPTYKCIKVAKPLFLIVQTMYGRDKRGKMLLKFSLNTYKMIESSITMKKTASSSIHLCNTNKNL